MSLKSTMKFNSLFNSKSDILPTINTKEKYNNKYEPQDFYDPIKFDPTKNNLSSTSFRSKVTRFPSIKTTPHELDLEPYQHDYRLKEHRVFNRPWLQQIQATLGDVFINDNTNDGLINTAEIIESLKNESNKCSSSLLINKHSSVHDSKSNNKYIKSLTSINGSISKNNNNGNYIGNGDNEKTSDPSEEKVDLANKNPYSECFFIKEPYPIITDNQDDQEED